MQYQLFSYCPDRHKATELSCLKMRYDPDVIAYLFPVEGQGRDGATDAINMLR